MPCRRRDVLYTFYSSFAAENQPPRLFDSKMESTALSAWPKRASLLVLGLYWVALAMATHWPQVQPPLSFRPSDKIQHLVAFGLLAVLIAFAWSRFAPLSARKLLAVLAIVAAYGVLDELTQPLTGRHRDPLDWVADVLGAALALACFALVARVLKSAPVKSSASAAESRPGRSS